jgi:hypothetical protein
MIYSLVFLSSITTLDIGSKNDHCAPQEESCKEHMAERRAKPHLSFVRQEELGNLGTMKENSGTKRQKRIFYRR